MSKNFSTIPFYERVEKPWGYEVHYTPKNLSRTGKILFVRAGKKPSFQYHDEKEETICLFSGKALIWLENEKGEIEKIQMELQRGYTVLPFQKHRVEAAEDSFFLEASSSETGTTVRLDDDYKRPDETEDVRSRKNRGWNE
ncbi:MAG: cupin [Candidatus Doudnabacteria bacterium]|nr:cupin [Candidatus Doudnabacteria bacterium]